MHETMTTRGWFIAMALYWLEAGPDALDTKVLAWCAGTAIWNGEDSIHRHLLPPSNRRSSVRSWLQRHRKNVQPDVARFVANGYAYLSEEGRALIETMIDEPAAPTSLPRATCFACGAKLAGVGRRGWMPYYACGHVTGWAGLGYVTVHSCPPEFSSLKTNTRTRFPLATGVTPVTGMKVRYRLGQFDVKPDVDAPDIPSFGAIAGLHGACAAVLPDGKPDNPDYYHPIPLSSLVEAGKADTTLLTQNQILVLERLKNGSAYVTRRKDGRGTIKAVADSRLGNITCTPGTWNALKHSGAIDPYIEAAIGVTY